MRKLIDRLAREHRLSREEWIALIQKRPEPEYLFAKARQAAYEYYGGAVFIRGLIEFTNYCRNNCYYCGIRRDNRAVARYRLSRTEILSARLCCRAGKTPVVPTGFWPG